MAVKKLAISLPEDVVDAVDAAAADRGVTRSRFIADVLHRVARARSDAEARRRVNALFADPTLVAEQAETAADMLRARRTSVSAPFRAT